MFRRTLECLTVGILTLISSLGQAPLEKVADTKFSIDGGIYDEPIVLEITTETPGATIKFTTDGSVPNIFNPRTKVYTAPLTIDHTTVLRAMADKSGMAATNLDTHTYIFLKDVLAQPDKPEGFPESWGDGPGVQASMPGRADYAVDPEISAATHVDQAGQAFTLEDALRAVPSLSIVLPIDSLLDPETGLHALARSKGAEWERPMSLEYLDETGKRRFQVNAGLRMQGGWNRFPESFKKSFRLYFRGEYGDAKLNYRLFPDTGVKEFDTLILRAGNGKAWSSPWRALTGSTNNSLERVTYLRDQLPRDLQHDMGHPTAHGRFVHLYINGLYWGLYNLVERIDEWFGPSYLGGEEDDYDVIKWIRSEGMVISAGNTDAWQEVLRLVRDAAITTPEGYAATAELVDMVNLIDYMLINFYLGNTDWPDNNSYTFRKRAFDGKFRFVCWDSEESLLSPGTSVLNKNNTGTAAEVFQQLLKNEDFQVLLADRIDKHFSKGGVLTDTYVSTRLLGRAQEIDQAIVGESARWGDLLRPSQPYTREHWLRELDNLQDNFFGRSSSSRQTATYNEMKSRNWAASVSRPRLSLPSGFVTRDSTTTLAKWSIFELGDLFHTIDGSDPRMPGGEVNPSALQGSATIALTRSTTIKARARSKERWSPLTEATYVVGTPASADNVILSEIMYHPLEENDPEFIELTNRSSEEVNLWGAKFDSGIQFAFHEDTLLGPGERLILTNNSESFLTRYGQSIRRAGDFANGTRLSNSGETLTLRAPSGEIIASASYDDSLPSADGSGHSLVLRDGMWQVSAEIGGSPGMEDTPSPPITPWRKLAVIRDSDSWKLVLTRESAPPDLEFTVELSTDLAAWKAHTAAPISETQTSITWTLPDAPERFARVRITQR